MTPTETIDAEIKRLNQKLAEVRKLAVLASNRGMLKAQAKCTILAKSHNRQIDDAHLRKQVIASERNLNGNLR